MLIKIKTNSRMIDILIEEVTPEAADNGLGIDQWLKVLEMCKYLYIPCEYLVHKVNEKVRETTPNFSGLKLLTIEERRQCLSSLDLHLGTHHQADLDNLFRRIEQRFSKENQAHSFEPSLKK